MYRPERALVTPTQTALQTATKTGSGGASLVGKGYLVQHVEQVLARMGMEDVGAIARAAVDARVRHVVIKIANGANPFPIPANDPDGRKEQLTAELVAALRHAGITVWGWASVYGPQISPNSQAHALARRARQFELQGLVINVAGDDMGQWLTGDSMARGTPWVNYSAAIRSTNASARKNLSSLSAQPTAR